MKPIDIGNIRVQKVLDQERAGLSYKFFYPQGDWGVCEANRSWLDPHHIDFDKKEVLMSYHSYVVQTGRSNILIDACIGNHKNRPLSEAFHMQNSDYLKRLSAIGLQPEDIDFVLCTHLHPDHIGWNTQLIDGRWVPTFPNARYIFGQKEYDHWQKHWEVTPRDPFMRESYFDSVLPVIESGQSELVSSDHEIENGVWLEPSYGHSPGHTCLNVKSGTGHGIFSGDAIHHPIQLADPDLIPFFDQDKKLAMESRRSLIDSIVDTQSILLPAHFGDTSAGRVKSDGDAFSFDFVD